MGNLNSGLQLYRIKYEKPELFQKIKYALHLPQYMSYLISGQFYSDLTSIGCHTGLWDFKNNEYHPWVEQEGLLDKLAPIEAADKVVEASFPGNTYQVGIGLHDSSAALIPYLLNFHEPFILISTGTWCISLNPFNQEPLTANDLKNDCLSYLSYEGKPIKASRLFAGYDHEQQVKRLANYFQESALKYRTIEFNPELLAGLRVNNLTEKALGASVVLKSSLFASRDLSQFSNYEEAYHQLMLDIIKEQEFSTHLVLNDKSVKRIFVDGGFSKNPVYMNLLATAFPDQEVFAASMAQATAVGSALAIHASWNQKNLRNDIIELKYYSISHNAIV